MVRLLLLVSTLFVSLTSCASVAPCVGSLPNLSVTDAVTRTPYRVEAGTMCLQSYEWKAQIPVRAAMVVVHGIRDHAVRYEGLATALAKEGVTVYAQDLRGHGRSGGDRQRFESMDELIAHVDLAVAEAKQRNPGVPVFVYGHSLGGLIAATYAWQRGTEVAGVVLSGPALKLFPNVTGGEKFGARLFGAILPGLKVQAVDDSEFVREAAEQKALAEDPLVDHENLPARSAAMGINAIETIQEHLSDIRVPLLIMHGTVDKATNIEGSEALAAKASSTDKGFKRWEGLHHDLLHEPERNQVIAHVVQWVNAHLSPK